MSPGTRVCCTRLLAAGSVLKDSRLEGLCRNCMGVDWMLIACPPGLNDQVRTSPVRPPRDLSHPLLLRAVRAFVLVGAALGNLAARIEFTRIASIIRHGSSIIQIAVGECYSRFDVLRHPRRGTCRAADALSRHALGVETSTRGGARSKAIYRYSSCRRSPACWLNYIYWMLRNNGEG